MDGKKGLLSGINKPLGFFALALLIVESFLSIVLVFSDLPPENRFLGMLLGIGLFIVVTLVVAVLVWCKPKDLMYGEESHLEQERMYGTREHPVTKNQLIKMQKSESNGKVGRRK